MKHSNIAMLISRNKFILCYHGKTVLYQHKQIQYTLDRVTH